MFLVRRVLAVVILLSPKASRDDCCTSSTGGSLTLPVRSVCPLLPKISRKDPQIIPPARTDPQLFSLYLTFR